MQYAERPLSADALRLLDRKNTGRVSTGRSPGALEESNPARHGSIRRWTQWPPEHPNHEKQPLMTSAEKLEEKTYNNLHAVPDDSMVPSKRVPLSGLHEMMSASMTLSKESEEILKDRAVTCAIACSSMILLLQGLDRLHGLAFSYYMKDELKVSPAMLTSISSISGLPWVIKPLYGFASDAFPILGYHRKPYLFMAGVLGFISWVCMAEVVTQVWEAAIFITLPSLGMAVANVIGEALVVAKSRGRSQEYTGRLQTIIYSAKETGAILSGFTGGWLLSFMTARHVFLLASFIPLVLIIVSLVLQEERNTGHGTEWSEVQNNVRKLYHAFCRPQIWKPVAFLFFYNCTPSSGSSWFFFYTDVTKFSSTFLGTQSLVGSVFSLVGVLLFDATMRKVSFLPIFVWGTLVSVVLGLTHIILILRWNLEWGIPDWAFSLGEASVGALIGWIMQMPVFILAARLCPQGMEATMYATIMSVINLSGQIGGQGGAALTWALGITEHNLDHFWLLVLICNLSSLLPLLLIGWISEDPIDDIDSIMSLSVYKWNAESETFEFQPAPLSVSQNTAHVSKMDDAERLADGSGSNRTSDTRPQRHSFGVDAERGGWRSAR